MTSDTIEDLVLAESNLEYAARRSPIDCFRAEAQTYFGVVRQMDHHRPTWRNELLADLSDRKLQHELWDLLQAWPPGEDPLQVFLDSLFMS